MSDSLPPGWAWARIAEVVTRVPNIAPEREPEREFGYVDISSIDNARFTISGIRLLRGKDAPSRARRPVQPHDVLFSNVRTYLRNIATVPVGCLANVCSTGFTVLRPNRSIQPRFLFYYTLTDEFIHRVTPQQTGTHYPATSDRVVMGERIPVPPLAEQRRIVAKLDALLSKVDSTRKRLDRIPALLKRFRQAVLAAACSGRLTADWRVSDRDDGEPPSGWRLVEFGSVIDHGPHNGLYKPQTVYGSGTPIVRIDAFYDSLITDWSKLKRVRLGKHEIDQYALANGDILINRVNSPKFLGKCALVLGLPEPSVYESNMMRLRLDTAMALPEYTILYLQSAQGLVELRKNAKHAINQSSINQTDVRSALFALPSVPEQHEIVHRVESLFALADQIEARYAKAKAHVDRLTQSILAKAFRGELVPQDPSDEPASVMLERMRQKRPLSHNAHPRCQQRSIPENVKRGYAANDRF